MAEKCGEATDEAAGKSGSLPPSRAGSGACCCQAGACDRHNFVLGFNIAPSNTHDSTMFDGLYDDVTARFTEAKAVAVGVGYKTSAIMKKILDSERIPCVPYKRPMTKEGFFKKYEYIYDEYYDCILLGATYGSCGGIPLQSTVQGDL